MTPHSRGYIEGVGAREGAKPHSRSVANFRGIYRPTGRTSQFPSERRGHIPVMAALRDKAIHRKAGELAEDAQHLERLSRDHPLVAANAGVAKDAARRAEQLAEEQVEVHTDLSLTSRDDDELRRRAITDEDAVAEICRREAVPAAA